jgi:serine/threonine protein kinase
MGAQPGERIGPYRLLHQIGGGGMGQVFAATDERTDQAAALKLLSPEAAQDPRAPARDRRETSRTQHWNGRRFVFLDRDVPTRHKRPGSSAQLIDLLPAAERRRLDRNGITSGGLPPASRAFAMSRADRMVTARRREVVVGSLGPVTSMWLRRRPLESTRSDREVGKSIKRRALAKVRVSHFPLVTHCPRASPRAWRWPSGDRRSPRARSVG